MKTPYRALVALFAGIFLLAGCQGQAPASQSADAAAASAVSQPPAADDSLSQPPASSSAPQPAQEWGTAGIGDTVTVAGSDLTLESFEIGKDEIAGIEDGIIIKLSIPKGLDEEISNNFYNWCMDIPDVQGWTGGGVPYLLSAEGKDGSAYRVVPNSMYRFIQDNGGPSAPGLTLIFRQSTWEGGELPANPTYHLSFADETSVIPGFTFS